MASTLSTGETAWLMQMREDEYFRSNIGFCNMSPSPATVEMTLYAWVDSDIVDTFTITLQPNQVLQRGRPFLAHGEPLMGGYARARVVSGSGVIVYGSAIDAGTGDPTTIPMKK